MTPEDRRLLAETYRLMVKDAGIGNTDAFDGLMDPFWQFYADVFLGGHSVVMQAVLKQIKSRTTK